MEWNGKRRSEEMKNTKINGAKRFCFIIKTKYQILFTSFHKTFDSWLFVDNDDDDDDDIV